jgi:hypothetical protein
MRKNRIVSSMKESVRSPKALLIFGTVTGFLCLFYLLNLVFDTVTPGNLWGIAYGTLAALLMVGVALLGVRRRVMKLAAKRPLGTAKSWLQFHLYGGVLALLLTGMHTGFSVPSGLLELWLWIFALWVTISGLLGVVIQKTIPRLLCTGLGVEVVYERIPELVREIQERAKNIIVDCTEPVQDFYRRNMAAILTVPKFRITEAVKMAGGLQMHLRQFDYLRRVLSTDEQERLAQLHRLYKTKLEIDVHYTLQTLLRVWLYSHVPASLILLALLGIHLWGVWAY